MLLSVCKICSWTKEKKFSYVSLKTFDFFSLVLKVFAKFSLDLIHTSTLVSKKEIYQRGNSFLMWFVNFFLQRFRNEPSSTCTCSRTYFSFSCIMILQKWYRKKVRIYSISKSSFSLSSFWTYSDMDFNALTFVTPSFFWSFLNNCMISLLILNTLLYPNPNPAPVPLSLFTKAGFAYSFEWLFYPLVL